MISVGSMIHNESAHIIGMLDNIKSYTDDIKIVDQSSDDGTIEKINKWAKTFDGTVTIETTNFKGTPEPDRTRLLQIPKYEWVFMIDADERLPAGIPFDEIIAQGYEAYNFPMRSLYFKTGSGYELMSYEDCLKNGTEIYEGYPDWHPRLLRKGTIWPHAIHDRPRFKRILNIPEYDMLHLKTLEIQLRKNEHYMRQFPEWAARMTEHSQYVTNELNSKLKK